MWIALRLCLDLEKWFPTCLAQITVTEGWWIQGGDAQASRVLLAVRWHTKYPVKKAEWNKIYLRKSQTQSVKKFTLWHIKNERFLSYLIMSWFFWKWHTISYLAIKRKHDWLVATKEQPEICIYPKFLPIVSQSKLPNKTLSIVSELPFQNM